MEEEAAEEFGVEIGVAESDGGALEEEGDVAASACGSCGRGGEGEGMMRWA